jgi:hypothetical protein
MARLSTSVARLLSLRGSALAAQMTLLSAVIASGIALRWAVARLMRCVAAFTHSSVHAVVAQQ